MKFLRRESGSERQVTEIFLPDRRAMLLSAAGLCLSAGPAAAAASCHDYIGAFHFGFPIFEFARTAHRQIKAMSARGETSPATFNHRAQLADHTARSVTTPNNDTIYSSARLDLTNGPALIEIPSVAGRYFSVAFMNAFTDNFAFVGTRATGGAGGRFLVAGPRWKGARPPGVQIIRSVSDDVWTLARIGVAGESDLAAASSVQRQIRLVSAAPPAPLTIAPSEASDAENFAAVVSAMLARVSATAISQAKRRRLLEVGLGDPAGLSESQRIAWRAVIPTAMNSLASGFAAGGDVVNGWQYPSPDIGDQFASDEVRAATALSGLAALSRKEAVYVASHTDNAGQPLHGARRYRLFLPPSVPTDAFWSLSIYRIEPDGRLFFFQNPIGRYSIGDATPQLRRRADGAVTILVAPNESDQTNVDDNWLPSTDGPIRLVFRLYLPRRPILDGTWRLPPIVAVA